MRRSVSIFGSTGSIGRNTVDLIQRQGGHEAYDVAVLTGSGNIALLADQARALRAGMAVTADPAQLGALRQALAGSGTEVAAGPAALEQAAARPVDWAMSAIVGAAGLRPTLALARHGGILALANKESLVCAGDLLKATCAAHGTRLVPVDSEHSAIHQAMNGERRAEVERIILTASGGPFRDRSRAEMAGVTLAQAVAHPNWSMGQRISIDSATMFNKALEVIEAAHLFDAPGDMIEVVVHPQSIIHSMVGFKDGAIIAQMGPTDMRGAIGYALNWPQRAALPVSRLDFAALSRLDFAAADPVRFPALRLAREVLAAGGLSGAVLNGAKEAALDAFIAGQIGFLDMAALVERVLDRLSPSMPAASGALDIDAVMAIDARARACCQELIRDGRTRAGMRPAPATAES
jgi:1-deoxy-D-xylulose-5-phosphate reductoisomerase